MGTSTIELFKEAMKFSAGHFTIFSATRRERLHGHNFTVYCALTGEVDANGLLGDYVFYRQRLIDLCREWNEVFLLPGRSPHLRIEHDHEAGRVNAIFAGQVIPFLASDVLVLPVTNVTVEELSRALLDELLRDREVLARDRIREVVIKVGSGPGQMASCRWSEGT
ncbi:6-pyruvoyl trahydropterin synthase family protein [Paraliomyxa miuraensis]|uniref:6-pyruvoyl trahydropterin synthase family protein n=1 Tax=Paraliomyxa miuraensis TaxID=376150 RepID=UPI0022597AA7|nr:6-carboxytetrahydropterin synthase [Paraliomyxa miuraensis]MCX4240473.1 6-carboxytetrahydropterin synthase [Paraliomyxa miuraensis]